MNKELLGRLYLMYQKEIRLYLYSLCRNAALTEDLLQETFLKALLSLPDDHTNMKAWLYLVARNLCFNYLKRENRMASLEDAPETDDEGTQALFEQIFVSERNRILYQALGRLDTRKREIIQMQYFGGLSQKEIAAILHMTPENVRVLAYRAKRELKSYLEVLGYDVS